jgi:hypothetical protein
MDKQIEIKLLDFYLLFSGDINGTEWREERLEYLQGYVKIHKYEESESVPKLLSKVNKRVPFDQNVHRDGG